MASTSNDPSYSQVVQNTGGATAEANGILDKVIFLVKSCKIVIFIITDAILCTIIVA